MSEFGLPLRIGNGMMCCNERYKLLLEYFITFPTHVRMLERVSNSIYKACHGQHCVVATKNYTQNSFKSSDFGLTLRTGNGMLYYNEGYSLLLKCSITFIRCIRFIGRDSDSIYKPAVANTVLFLLPTTTLKFHEQYQLLGCLSSAETGYWATRRDSHCCLSVSLPSIDV